MTDEQFLEAVGRLTPEEKMILEMAIRDIKSGRDPKPPEEYRKILHERTA